MTNTINLVGRVGGEPEVKYFDSGKVKVRLTLAVDRRKKDSEPDWFALEIWGKTAEIANSYVHKGKQIGVSGALKIDSWQDKNTGAMRTSPVIIVNDLQLLGSARDDNGNGNGNGNGVYGGGYQNPQYQPRQQQAPQQQYQPQQPAPQQQAPQQQYQPQQPAPQQQYQPQQPAPQQQYQPQQQPVPQQQYQPQQQPAPQYQPQQQPNQDYPFPENDQSLDVF